MLFAGQGINEIVEDLSSCNEETILDVTAISGCGHSDAVTYEKHKRELDRLQNM